MDHHHHHHIEHHPPPCPLQHITSAFQSLDTVRALHHTVVSLRSALEDAQREIENLKKKISIQNDIEDGKVYRQTVDDSDKGDSKIVEANPQPSSTLGDLEKPLEILETKKHPEIIEENYKLLKCDEKPITVEKPFVKHTEKAESTDQEINISKKKTKKSTKAKYEVTSTSPKNVRSTRMSLMPDVRIITNPSSARKHQKQMASKIDVKIKVSSNINVDGTTSSSETTENNSGTEEIPKNTAEDTSSDATENSPRQTEKSSDLNIDFKTKDNLKISTKKRLNIATSSTENIHLGDITNSQSEDEGDNSVFEEVSTVQPREPTDSTVPHRPAEDSVSDNSESSRLQPLLDNSKLSRSSTSENHEEVDDIELIFSSDDKEFPQEDLVSISDYEPWEKTGTSGTPVLVHFTAIPSDQESGNNNNAGSNTMDEEQVRNQSQEGFYEAVEKETTSQQDRSFERSESLTDTDNYNKQFVNQKTEMSRDESFDTFYLGSSATALGRRWTNHNVLIETDISKCGIAEENILDMGRRNTCPNPPAYRPIIHREALAAHTGNNTTTRHTSSRCPLAVKFSRNSRSQYHPNSRSPRPILADNKKGGVGGGPKRSTSAQTEISALPEHWRSESNLIGGQYCSGFYTLPSKFIPLPGIGHRRHPMKNCDKSQEARRVMLSDINFTSMVPELSRSADHLCQEDQDQNNGNNENLSKGYYKGHHLKTPDYNSTRGITPSVSMTSPGVSQWTVNENSYGTQTTQTDNYNRGDSFDSCRSYSMSSRYSNVLSKANRSRSVPSVRCTICKQNHGLGLRTSESLHYTPRVTFQEPAAGHTAIRGSLPDLRAECTCTSRRSMLRIHGESSGSTESLLDEADDFLRNSMNCVDDSYRKSIGAIDNGSGAGLVGGPSGSRRYSENDIKRDYSPSKQSLPFLPKSPKCLKLGHLAKVITKNGRVVIGRVRYIGPLASIEYAEDEQFVGLQLPNKLGDCDGAIEGRKFFECEPQHGIFVPFKKIVMAWTA